MRLEVGVRAEGFVAHVTHPLLACVQVQVTDQVGEEAERTGAERAPVHKKQRIHILIELIICKKKQKF